MAVDRHYTMEKLSDGVGTLATHAGRVKDRVIAAMSAGLYGVNPDALSADARNVWSGIESKLGTETLQAMDDDEARRVAQAIWDTYVHCVADARRQSSR